MRLRVHNRRGVQVSQEAAVRRLKNYIEWVNRRLYTAEQHYFGTECRYLALRRQLAVADQAVEEAEDGAIDAETAGALMSTSSRADVQQQVAAWWRHAFYPRPMATNRVESNNHLAAR